MSAFRLKWRIDHPDYRDAMKPQLGALAKAQERLNQRKRGVGYFMEGGTGKTLAAYSTFIDLVDPKVKFVEKMCVAAPNFAKGVWIEQLANCGRVAKGANITVWPEVPHSDTDIFVYNYEMLIHPSKKVVHDFITKQRTLFVPDECHRGKDYRTKISHELVKAAKASPFTIGMTGTPMGESVLDLWPTLRMIGGISGTTPLTFRNEYAVMGGFMGKKAVGIREDNEPRLMKLIEECAYMAALEDRPDSAYLDIFCDMQPKQRAMYIQMYKERFLPLTEDKNVTADMLVTVLGKLQQIASGYVYDDEREVNVLVPPKDNLRMNALLDRRSDVKGKAIIFTMGRPSTMALGERMAKDSVYIIGGMKMEEIDARRKAFNEDPRIRNFIAPASMAKESITLLGDQSKERNACRDTFFYETTYSRIGRTQAEWRNNRKGQEGRVVRYHNFRQTSNLGRGVIDIDYHAGQALLRKGQQVDQLFKRLM